MSVVNLVEGEPSYLSSPDAREGAFYFHVTLLPSGGLSVVNVTHSPHVPSLEVERFDTSRKKLREEFEVIFKKVGSRVAPAPTAYVAARIHRAAELVRAAGGTLSARAEFELARIPNVTPFPPHPTLKLMPVADPHPRLMRQSDLLKEPELNTWMPPIRCFDLLNERLQAHVLEVVKSRGEGESEAEGSGDAFMRILHETVDAFYDDVERRRAAERLRDLALGFYATRRREQALDALCLADAVEAASPLTTAPSKVPFLLMLQARAMSMLSQAYGSRSGRTAR